MQAHRKGKLREAMCELEREGAKALHDAAQRAKAKRKRAQA
jgi:hypothetical protein